MKKSFLHIVAAFLLLSLHASYARQVTITILQTTDIHGHLLPTKVYKGSEAVGGLLACASCIRTNRSQNDNTLLVDCGDVVQGGIESYLTQGIIMMQAFKMLHYDTWVIGNHEFDWGLTSLRHVLSNSPVPVLAANIIPRPGYTNSLPNVHPFIMKNVDGVRIALVGMTTPGMPTWFRPSYLDDLLFENSVVALEHTMPAVRAKNPDIIVLLLHQGFIPFGDTRANQLNAIARAFPEIDVILGGHTHKVYPESMLNGVLYCQAGYYANWLGKVTLIYDTVKRAITEKHSTVIEIGKNYGPDKEMLKQFAPKLRSAREFANQEIAWLKTPMEPVAVVDGQPDVRRLICRAIAKATSADVVLHGVLADQRLEAGPVRKKDLWRIIPYENRIGVAYLTAAEIRQILEENLHYRGHPGFMMAWGLVYRVKKDAPAGQRVYDLRTSDGKFIHPRKRLRVAMNSYVLSSGGGRFPILRRIVDQPIARLQLLKLSTRTAVQTYLHQHYPVHKSPAM